MANKKGKGGKKGLIIGALVGLVVLGGGGFAGAAFMGVIKVKGITPASKMAASKALYGKEKKETVAAKPAPKKAATPVAKVAAPTPPKPKATYEVKVEEGEQKVADVWASMETEKLALLVADWDDRTLSRILVSMDDQKVAELLATMDAKRASKLSREIRDHAAKVPLEPN